MDYGGAGDSIGALIRGIKRDQVLAKPESVKCGSKFETENYALSKEEGGRRTPFFSCIVNIVCMITHINECIRFRHDNAK